jgi:glycosyltransferase involved in cell wall biosynthesis
MVLISIVIPIQNEVSLLQELIIRVKNAVASITEEFEIILIDDGSEDESWNLIHLEALKEQRIKGVRLSRNFGQHSAISAGLESASGSWIVVMDGDLQDRPEVIPELYWKALEGFEIVFVARQSRPESKIYRFFQKLFYSILRKLSSSNFDEKQANFSIISRRVVDAIRKLNENLIFYPSTVLWLGFTRTSIEANHGIRFSGRSSYNLVKRIKLAIRIVVSSSEKILYLSIYTGLIMLMITLFWIGYELFQKIVLDHDFIWWHILIISLFLSTSLVLISIGILGKYIGYLLDEVKRRPSYVIFDKINF